MVLQRHLIDPSGSKPFQSIGLDNQRYMKSSNLYLILIQWHEADEGGREIGQTPWTAVK